MIENRVRIEREILRGRRSVRKAIYPRSLASAYEGSPIDQGNAADMSYSHPFSPDSATLDQENILQPSDTDTDASVNLSRNGSLGLLLEQAGTMAPTSPALSGNPTTLHLPHGRFSHRRWASQQFEDEDVGSTLR